MEAVNGRKCEVCVERVGLEPLYKFKLTYKLDVANLHDGKDRYTVPPDIARDVMNLSSTNPTAVQIYRSW